MWALDPGFVLLNLIRAMAVFTVGITTSHFASEACEAWRCSVISAVEMDSEFESRLFL